MHLILKSKKTSIILALILASMSSACSTKLLPSSQLRELSLTHDGAYLYQIGTNDILSVFIWGNPDLTGDYPVRPDGRISVALTGALIAAGLTTEQLEKTLEVALAEYIKAPKVTVVVKSASGFMPERVKLVGDAVKPASLPYMDGMTLLDLMIAVGGLSPYADGNDAILLRFENGELTEYPLRIYDLMSNADMSANVDLSPGDVIRVSEAWF
jgi:polysaccharide export outer membrane protein